MSVLLLGLENFEKEVIESSKGILVLVDFFAEWCGPCKMLAPVLSSLESEMNTSVKFCKFNVDTKGDDSVSSAESPAIVYRIASIPTIVFFKDGKEVARVSGALSKSSLRDKISTLL